MADKKKDRLQELEVLVEDIRPMIEAYREWATGLMSASKFGEIADRSVIAYDEAADTL